MKGEADANAIESKTPRIKIHRVKVRRVKTFTGCWGCRSRKVKCDEKVPECSPCQKTGLICKGYQPDYVWVASDLKTYQPGRRRALQSHLTWRDHPLLGSEEIDALIAQCDVGSLDQLAQTGGWHVGKAQGPFSVFSCRRNDEHSMTPIFYPNLTTQRHDRSSYLFNHYTSHVALNMMPFKDRRNPWQSFYPSLARYGNSAAHKSLFHAILAQAAANLACLGRDRQEMLALTTQHYTQAVQNLRSSLEEEQNDFGTVIATVLTLIMAEVYGSSFNAWRLHLKGGWEFLKSYQGCRPWLESDFAWMTTQSLCLLKIRTDTMRINTSNAPQPLHRNLDSFEESIITSVAGRSDFGFTIGANQGLVACIKDITLLAAQLRHEGYTSSLCEAASQLLQRLDDCSSDNTDPKVDAVVQCHQRIFHAGTLIYFSRSIWKVPPCNLNVELSSIFHEISLYRRLGGGYITLWPVFIAAMEAYQKAHMVAVRAWLDIQDQMGAASRQDIRAFIEEIWRRRQSTADNLGVEKGTVVIDWVEVMREWHWDLLLV